MVFLVALPLSLGIAVASGAPVLAGLIAAVVGGIVVGSMGGSPLQVSGPAAGMTVVVADLIAEFGWAVTCLITVAAGVIQVVLGLSRVARAVLGISPVVVDAMLAGIGITIVLQQLHVLLGGQPKNSAWHNVTGLPEQLIDARGQGLLLGVLVIATLVAWRWVPKPIAFVPGSLVAIGGVTLLSVVVPFDVARIQLGASLTDALTLPKLPEGNWGAFAVAVLTLALIASVQSLLTAMAVDRLHNGPRTELNRELIAQGAANIASGVIGGLAITAVIVRSSANINAGAKSRAAAILQSVWVLLFTVPLAALIQQLPTAALAGLLIVIGIQLLRSAIQTVHRNGEIPIYLVTAVGVVFVDVLHGVVIGLTLAIGVTGWRVIRATIEAEHIGDQWHVTVAGACTFLALPRLTRILAPVPVGASVTFDMRATYLDRTALHAIDDWQRNHCATGGTVDIAGMSTDIAATGTPGRLPKLRSGAQTPRSSDPGNGAGYGGAPWPRSPRCACT